MKGVRVCGGLYKPTVQAHSVWYSGAGRAVIWGTWLRTIAFPGKVMGRMLGGAGVLYVWVTRHGWAWGLCREAGWR